MQQGNAVIVGSQNVARDFATAGSKKWKECETLFVCKKDEVSWSDFDALSQPHVIQNYMSVVLHEMVALTWCCNFGKMISNNV